MKVETIAKKLGCTPGQVRHQFWRNAMQLSMMADKAERTGKRVNGFTELELRRMAEAAWNKCKEVES